MAIGVPLSNVRVQALPFVYEDAAMAQWRADLEAAEAAQRNRELVEMIIMYAVIVLLGVMVFLLGRAIVKALRPEAEPEPALVVAGAGGYDFLVDGEEIEEVPASVAEIETVSKSPGLEQVEKFIDRDAASVAQLLRNWLSDDSD